MGVFAGALTGGLFFYWIAGPRVLDPRQYEWLMKLDWRINFLGWHLYRNDPWTMPPGLLRGYLAGEGTSIGLTDSIPLAAMLLKPFDPWLPAPFQYFGLWLLLCFVLQGAFGALITRCFTSSVLVQALGSALFVLLPTLLMRVGHAALTAHFLLLWALWINLRGSRAHPASTSSQVVLAVMAALTHPYLSAMTLALLAAVPLRDRTRQSVLAFALVLSTSVAAWWAAGFIAVGDGADLSAGGLGLYSMNVLSPITPRGWSTMLPEWPVASEQQAYEGFQYLGAGVVLLLGAAGSAGLARRRVDWRSVLPVTIVCTLCAVYALSPRITAGDLVVVDLVNPTLERLAFFRATGRFFWPMAYLLLSGAIAILLARLRIGFVIMILAVAVMLQFADQRNAHEERRVTSRSDAFHTWPRQLTSGTWHVALPHYAHVVLAPASQCGGAPLEHEELAFLAGLHGLTINSGLGARWNEAARRRYCGELLNALAGGHVEDTAVYVVSGDVEARLRQSAKRPLICGSLDVARVCVTAVSYERWRTVASLTDAVTVSAQ